MIRPVIAGIDGSAESLAAAEWAAHEAVRRDRPLRLVHVWNWHPRQDGELATAAARHLGRRALRQAEERIGHVCPGVRLDDEQVEGPATTALLRASEQADMLVLGSRGLSGLTGFLVGSVGLGVVARARRPVVLVRAREQAEDEPLPADDGSVSTRPGHHEVVLGIDLGDPCDQVIDFAFEAARTRGARLRAVHASQPPGPFVPGPGEVGILEGPQRAEEWLGFMTATLEVWRDKYPDVQVTGTVTEGRAQSVLVRASSGADLVVVGRRITGRPGLAHTGPVTHAAIHHVVCPVAVVPHE
ncbi:universal stress protein [Streptomyces sp. NBC_00075]|uniref:universal stress protein n=1 Tax=Streptomyces sp. NBC_00075 TaxID=2975641 RepID=UPI0032545408